MLEECPNHRGRQCLCTERCAVCGAGPNSLNHDRYGHEFVPLDQEQETVETPHGVYVVGGEGGES